MWLIYSNKINTYEQQEAALRIISKYAVSALGGYQQVAWLRVISACIVETVMWVALSGIPIDTEKKRSLSPLCARWAKIYIYVHWVTIGKDVAKLLDLVLYQWINK